MAFLHPELHLVLHSIPSSWIPDGTGLFTLQMNNYREGEISSGTKQPGADRQSV